MINVIKEFFSSKLSIEHVTSEAFVQNITTLFKTVEGIEILKGNIDSFVKYELAEITDYNMELMQRQALETASKAWEDGDYKAFVKSVEKIGIEKIPQSYLTTS